MKLTENTTLAGPFDKHSRNHQVAILSLNTHEFVKLKELITNKKLALVKREFKTMVILLRNLFALKD